ncbi:MAG TPA: AAA family ATPase, partial [Acidimicrobiia bacterium]|nr:AAA family ATPase [Acidimicrobiia bacterium]
MKHKVLLTGMSGAGKSTVLSELARRGHRTVDTDVGDWIEQVQTPDGLEPMWRRDAMRRLLDSDSMLFVAGCVANQGEFYPHFDAVVLLTAPLETLLERVATRTSNDFGKSSSERARIVADFGSVEPLLRASATLVVDTRASVATVVDQVLALV